MPLSLPDVALPPGKTYEATIYADAPDGDGFDNPEVYTITTKMVDNTSKDVIHMAPGEAYTASAPGDS